MKVYVCILGLVALAQGAILPNFNGNSRIVGGEDAVANQFPYQVGLKITGDGGAQFFCGGSLISRNYVITAAHCADIARSVEVIMGALTVKEHEPSQQRQVSTELHVHEEWDPRPHHAVNDIALIKLPNSIEITDSVAPVKLPTRSDADNDYVGVDATVSGWGITSDNAGIADTLQFLDGVIISNKECQETFTEGVIPTMLCTKGKKQHQSTCSGDSGGPLAINKDGVARQVGLVSWGSDLGCEKSFPYVFTRLTKYLDWIEKNSDVTIDP